MITARCCSDDREVDITFDATDYFENIKSTSFFMSRMNEFITFGFGGNIPADNVAEFFEDSSTQELFDHLKDTDPQDDVGFECYIVKEDVIKWLKLNDLYEIACLFDPKVAASMLVSVMGKPEDNFNILYKIKGDECLYEATVCPVDGCSDDILDSIDLFGCSAEMMARSMFSSEPTSDGWLIDSVCGYNKADAIEVIKSIENKHKVTENV